MFCLSQALIFQRRRPHVVYALPWHVMDRIWCWSCSPQRDQHVRGYVPTYQRRRYVLLFKSALENLLSIFVTLDIKFPADYPMGVLLGHVNLVNCLTQEQYRCEFPDGEVEDPYVFISENPQALPVRYPIKGQPKICTYFERRFVSRRTFVQLPSCFITVKFDGKVHEAAVACLRKFERAQSQSEHKVKSIRP